MAEMTKEQAAMVLDPETSEEAMEEIKQLSGYNGEDMELKVIRDACRVAVNVLRLPCDFVGPNKIAPLTLEQLREMGGQPVWIVESPDWGHWELSEDAEDYLCDRDADLYGLTYPDPDGKAGLHKLGWLAYAYPPAHIDREAWNRPCLFCCEKSKGRKTLAFDSAGDAVTLEIDGNKAAIESDSMGFIVEFCPKCGRPLTDEAWAELEKRLRG